MLHLADPLRHAERAGAEDLAVVEFLKRFAVALIGRHLADEQHHRRRILERGVQTDRRIARAGAARHEAHARPRRQLALRFGHEGRTAFVAAGDEADALGMRVKAVEHRQVAFARHAEDGIDALRDQRFDERVTRQATSRGAHAATRRDVSATRNPTSDAEAMPRPSDNAAP